MGLAQLRIIHLLPMYTNTPNKKKISVEIVLQNYIPT